jgi:uncharacterized protein YcbX
MQKIAQLYLYPFKSLGAMSVSELNILPDHSVQFDRKWMLVDKQMNFVTQRELPELAGFSVHFSEPGQMLIRYRNHSLNLPLVLNSGKPFSTQVWSRKLQALAPDSTGPSQWFSDLLHREVYPVFFSSSINKSHHRPAAFADSSPLLVISLASVQALNARLSSPVSALNFRPNIILEGLDAFLEDSISMIKINELSLKFMKTCSRCMMVNVDPQSGTRNASGEPLKTLASFRKFDKGKVKFGAYFLPSAGCIPIHAPFNWQS